MGQIHRVECEIGGRTLIIETGRVAKQAAGSVTVRYGDTIVLVTACASADPREGIDFLPLTVDYLEKTFAAGKIPGGFFKREGKPTEKETLTSRFIDRPIRPLFPEGWACETQIIATVLSADTDNDPDTLAMIGASTALTISDIPFNGPIGGCRIGRVDGQIVINPTLTQLNDTDLEIILAASKDAIVMVEGGAQEASESEMIAALKAGHEALQPVIAAQNQLRALVNKEKRVIPPVEKDVALEGKVREFAQGRLVKAFAVKEKLARGKAIKEVKKELKAALITDDSPEELEGKVSALFGDLEAEIMRTQIASQKQRIDGRSLTEIRPITIEVGILPRAHGSALFTRGETQALVTATLGTSEDIQIIDTLLEEGTKHFMLHYNFPPFSVGETKPLRSPGRREIGHGALAERSVTKVLPDEEKFPYVIRIVSEILESNGSSSMASVCGSSLAMMDAGVPIRSAVAGIAMGLIKEGDQYLVLSDILGDEDHLGDMDFKVAGTSKGITALQMDIKIEGLPPQVMEQALEQARQGRLHILGEMAKGLSEPRPAMSPYAPRIVQIQINKERIRDIIGPGGKVIRGIVEQTGAKIDVEDDGSVKIFSNNEQSLTKARRMIEAIVEEPIEGRVYRGKVRKVVEFGAFVEIIPGTDGLLHISQLADKRVGRVTDVVQEGDEIIVKCIRLERDGKIGLSLKDAVGLRPDAEGGGRLDEPPPNKV